MTHDVDTTEDEDDEIEVFPPNRLCFDVREAREDEELELFMDELDENGEREGNDCLGGHNVKGLPAYFNTFEDAECQWSLRRGQVVSKDQIVMDMVALGFVYHQGMINW